MSANYIKLVSQYYPGVECSASNPFEYNTIQWKSTVISQVDLDTSYINEYKLVKRQEVNNKRDALVYGGYVDTNNVHWGSSPIDIQNLNAVCTLIAVGAVTNNVTWRDTANTNHNLTVTELITLAAQLGVYVSTCYQVSWAHKANIDALTTIADIDAYDFSGGWPA